MAESDLPDYLVPTCNLLVRAFPEKPTPVQYFAMLELLAPRFSVRNLAIVVEHAFDIPYATALNDVYGAISPRDPAEPETTAAVTRKLRAAGYEE